MKTVEEYLRHAARSDELAAEAETQEHKAQIEQIAKMWRDLARQREQLLNLKKPAK